MTDARQDRSAPCGPVIDLPTVGGVLRELFDRLTGKEAGLWLAAAKRFLRKENPWGAFPTWKTVELGAYASLDDLRTALEACGMPIGAYAGAMLARVTLSTRRKTLELVLVSGAQLGLEKGGTIAQHYAAALVIGFELCPAEVAPLMRIKYNNQKRGERLYFAMKGIISQGFNPNLFALVHNEGGQCLYSSDGDPHVFYGPNDLWVFVRRKSAVSATK